MTLLIYRPAKPDDAALCINIQGLTRENVFSEEESREPGIIVESWSKGIQDGSRPGFIVSAEGQMIDYCLGDRDAGEIAVLALLLEYEGQGVGKRLLAMVIEELKKHEFHCLFLSCSSDPNVHSYGFHRRLGWSPTGEKDEYGDEVLEIKLKHYRDLPNRPQL